MRAMQYSNMKSILPATHLIRQFVLFALTVLLLLTVMRSAYVLWQFPIISANDAFLSLFIQGLRFDLALISKICIVPVVLGSLLSIAKATRVFAKLLIVLFLMVGLFLILTLELLTPWFISTEGVRPDHHVFGMVESPVDILKSVLDQHTVPFVIGVLISVLILIAFWVRLEYSRFLRRKVFAPTGILFACVGGLACLLAIWSTPNFTKSPFSPTDSLTSADITVNELAMNTTYKTVNSLISLVYIPTQKTE